ncbi:MAG: sulfatase-like hydrolase/transferase, partial [Desulfobacteraceae bacterium]
MSVKARWQKRKATSERPARHNVIFENILSLPIFPLLCLYCKQLRLWIQGCKAFCSLSQNIACAVTDIDAHDPYVYHKEFDRGNDRVDPSYYPRGSNDKRIRKYDSEIGFVDHYIDKLIQKIKEHGLYENSLVIFLADHG